MKSEINDERLKSIDIFRGFIILLMIIVNFIKVIDWVPSFLKHAPYGGVTFVDIIFPAFIFIIGLTYPLSFQKRSQLSGKSTAAKHSFQRGLSFIGIEVLFYLYVQLLFGYREYVIWNTLSIIGFTIICAIPLINCNSYLKLFIGCGLLLFHELVPLAKIGSEIYREGGGAYSLAGWCSIMYLSLFMSDLLFKKGKNPNKIMYLVFSIGFTILGLVSGIKIPFVRDGMSLSFGFLSIGISSLGFFLFYLFDSKFSNKWKHLSYWGKNPLIVYLVSICFIPINIGLKNTQIFSRPNIIMLLYFVAYLGILESLVIFLGRKGKTIKF